MREIKFRMWAYPENEMKGWEEANQEISELLDSERHGELDGEPCGVYIMQFTGLKDKNGKEELYENDIAKGTYRDGKGFTNKQGIIKYHMSSFVLHCFDEDIDDSKPLDYYNYGFEKLGNIYENPELL